MIPAAGVVLCISTFSSSVIVLAVTKDSKRAGMLSSPPTGLVSLLHEKTNWTTALQSSVSSLPPAPASP